MKYNLLMGAMFFGMVLPLCIKAQTTIYIGEGVGSYKYYSGSLATRAFEFNNNTDVTKEMNPDRIFSGATFGFNVNLALVSFGLDYAFKYNNFSGKRELGANVTTDAITQSLNSFYVNFGLGNNIDYRDQADGNDKKIVWRIQTGVGMYSFKLKQNLVSPTENFSGILGSRTGISCRSGINVWIPIYKKFELSIMPYYEFDTGGGYVELLEDKIKNSEYFNITHFGLNLNLNYAF
ncbi:MAG: hypothetical protein NT150_07835 [Bacteroidetes bacterium]|nr:hypothetical protein [Bacteroidota bacterium]